MSDPITQAFELVWGRALNSTAEDWASAGGKTGKLSDAEYLAYQATTFEQARSAIEGAQAQRLAELEQQITEVREAMGKASREGYGDVTIRDLWAIVGAPL